MHLVAFSTQLTSRWLTIPLLAATLVPRVLRLFGQRFVARRDSEELEFYFHRIFAVKQCKMLLDSQSKYLNFFDSPGAQPLTKKRENSGYEIAC